MILRILYQPLRGLEAPEGAVKPVETSSGKMQHVSISETLRASGAGGCVCGGGSHRPVRVAEALSAHT